MKTTRLLWFPAAALAATVALLSACGTSGSTVTTAEPAATASANAAAATTMPMPMPTTTMAGMGGSGDGFTEVPGGIIIDEQHESHHGQDMCMDPITPEDYQNADKLIVETERVVNRYRSVADVEAAGYEQIAPPFNGEGAHWLNPDYMNDGRYADPDAIESLVISGSTITGAMYLMDTPNQAGIDVGGCLTPWHLHDNLCMTPDFRVVSIIGLFGDTCPSGSSNQVTPRMLHVWVEPHEGGPFAGIET